jgi:hypothetical protein
MGRMNIALVALALAAACGSEKSSPPAADPAGDDAALADRWVVLYGEYAAAMEKAGTDCSRAAAGIREVNAKNADLIASGEPRLAAMRADPARAAWLDERIKAKLGAALDRMAPTLDRCRGNPEVSAALAQGAFQKRAAADQPR